MFAYLPSSNHYAVKQTPTDFHSSGALVTCGGAVTPGNHVDNYIDKCAGYSPTEGWTTVYNNVPYKA